MKKKIISVERSYSGLNAWGYDDVVLDDGTEITLRQKPNSYNKIDDEIEI